MLSLNHSLNMAIETWQHMLNLNNIQARAIGVQHRTNNHLQIAASPPMQEES